MFGSIDHIMDTSPSNLTPEVTGCTDCVRFFCFEATLKTTFFKEKEKAERRRQASRRIKDAVCSYLAEGASDKTCGQ